MKEKIVSGEINVVCQGRARLASKSDFIGQVRCIRERAGRNDLIVNVLLTDDKGIRRLNSTYKKKNVPTDILAFESSSDYHHKCVGDIAISVDTAKTNAKHYKTTTKKEILRYVAHGILHLSGWKDDTAQRRECMRREEDRIINNL